MRIRISSMYWNSLTYKSLAGTQVQGQKATYTHTHTHNVLMHWYDSPTILFSFEPPSKKVTPQVTVYPENTGSFMLHNQKAKK